MKFAICNETFQDWPLDKAFAYACQLGYRGLEVAPFTLAADAADISPDQRSRLRDEAHTAGLTIVGLHWLLAGTEGYYLTSPDPQVRQTTGHYFRQLAELCRDLGGEIMVLGSPQQRNLLPGVTTEQACDYACDTIRRAVTAFEDCQVTLALEPLGPAEGDFLLTAAEARRLIDRIDSPTVRLHLDVKAMSSESESIPDIIRKSAQHLVHFHANDPNRRGPGMGDVDFVPILAALQKIDYDGWVSVEVFDYEPGVETLASDSIRNLQMCLDRLT